MSGTPSSTMKRNNERDSLFTAALKRGGSSPVKLVIAMGAVTVAFVLVVYAVIVSLGATKAPVASAPVKPTISNLSGKAAPAFSLPTLFGKGSLSLASFRGHPVVLNFFASWCSPCKAELPFFATTAKASSSKVDFIGIDENDSASSARALVTRDRVAYSLVSDSNGAMSGPYGLYGLPTTFAIGANGKVVAEVAGQISQSQLNQLVSEAESGRVL